MGTIKIKRIIIILAFMLPLTACQKERNAVTADSVAAPPTQVGGSHNAEVRETGGVADQNVSVAGSTPVLDRPDITSKEENNQTFVYSGLVELAAVDSSVVIDQRYATKNNFTGQVLYPRILCLVHQDILDNLLAANAEAKRDGYRIKVFDAYRPISVQQKLYDATPPELKQYVPKPSPYSMHARGITVDITLVDENGDELVMPTEYDNFTEKAHADYKDLPAEQIKNRDYLIQLMSHHGFKVSKLEWWHFDGPNRDKYDILDIGFDEFVSKRDAEK